MLPGDVREEREGCASYARDQDRLTVGVSKLRDSHCLCAVPGRLLRRSFMYTKKSPGGLDRVSVRVGQRRSDGRRAATMRKVRLDRYSWIKFGIGMVTAAAGGHRGLREGGRRERSVAGFTWVGWGRLRRSLSPPHSEHATPASAPTLPGKWVTLMRRREVGVFDETAEL